MEIIKTAIPLGVETPFQVLHLSDTHLTRADLRDGERKVKLAKNRLPIFPEAEDVLQSACAYLAGVPTELMKSYPTDRFQQQLADEITLKVMEYIKDQPLIKALITGHLHFNYEGIYADRIPQIVTSCADARLIEIV